MPKHIATIPAPRNAAATTHPRPSAHGAHCNCGICVFLADYRADSQVVTR